MLYKYRSLLVKISGGVAFVKLYNPMNSKPRIYDTKRELADFFHKAQYDSRIRAILLTGKGGVFFAGRDLMVTSKAVDLADVIRDTDKPVVAAVNGYAIGAGRDLALACDMIIASEDAGFIEIEAGGLKESAHDAMKSGTISKVVKAGELFFEAASLALSLARGQAVSLDYARRIFNRSSEAYDDTQVASAVE